jgi:hypothetical protein
MRLARKTSLLGEMEGSVVDPAGLSLSVNGSQHLGYLSNPKEDDIMSLPILIGYGSMTFGSTWIEPMDIKRALFWKVLALAKVEAVKENGHEYLRAWPLMSVQGNFYNEHEKA